MRAEKAESFVKPTTVEMLILSNVVHTDAAVWIPDLFLLRKRFCPAGWMSQLETKRKHEKL